MSSYNEITLEDDDLWHILCELTDHCDMYHAGEKEKLAGFILSVVAEGMGYEQTEEDLEEFMEEYNFDKRKVDLSDVL